MKEKTKTSLITLLIIAVIILSIFVFFLFQKANEPKRVYFELEKPCFPALIDDMESFCEGWCIEEGYDGQRGYGSKEPEMCSCSCYKLVR